MHLAPRVAQLSRAYAFRSHLRKMKWFSRTASGKRAKIYSHSVAAKVPDRWKYSRSLADDLLLRETRDRAMRACEQARRSERMSSLKTLERIHFENWKFQLETLATNAKWQTIKAAFLLIIVACFVIGSMSKAKFFAATGWREGNDFSRRSRSERKDIRNIVAQQRSAWRSLCFGYFCTLCAIWKSDYVVFAINAAVSRYVSDPLRTYSLH